MRVVTVVGTRPEVIRLSRIVPKLDALCEHTLVHTGQNFDPRLNELFFEELGVRPPDYRLDARGSFAEQVGAIFAGCERIFRETRPERLLVLGDTNSALCALPAKRAGIPVVHMEAGNRCYDDRVPEEVNRRVIDHASDVLLPYTERSRQNLLQEGIPGRRIFVTGNPIFEVLRHYECRVRGSDVLARLGVREGAFFLVTAHRAENVDDPARLRALLHALRGVHGEWGQPVLVSTHPRTRERLAQLGEPAPAGVRFLEPFGFFDFVRLEQTARCVLTDSGTVQEECAILNRPNVTLRDTTERPETLECGSNVLAGLDDEPVRRAVRRALQRPAQVPAPPEYLAPAVSDTVTNLIVSLVPK